ncbi:MAG: DUF2851 family protein, partial [Chloroflexota bacterium]
MNSEAPALREASPPYDASRHTLADASRVTLLEEQALVALWLLGRVPSSALPLPLLRPGRAGRGPGPDVREATVLLPSGVTRTGDVEMHLRATDFVHHGHADDPAYARVILHVVWEDDRPAGWRGGDRGAPTPHLGGGAPVVEIAPSLHGDPCRLEALVARGPSGSGAEPCADLVARLGSDEAAARVRIEGQRRLAERAWRAGALVARYDWPGAWAQLLDRAVRATAGRRHESAAQHEAHLAAIAGRLGDDPLGTLITLARDARPTALIEGVRAPGFGTGRAAEVAWNAALPLLIAAATQYGDLELARATARLAEAWPTPAPYGKTTALGRLAGPAPRRPGALYAQGLLHLQDLWC